MHFQMYIGLRLCYPGLYGLGGGAFCIKTNKRLNPLLLLCVVVSKN